MTFSPGSRSCPCAASVTAMPARCCWPTCPAPWTPPSATRSSTRVTGTRSPCLSCRAPGTSPAWPAGSVFPVVSRSPGGSSRATSGASTCSRPTPSCSSSRLPRSPSATASCSTGPRGRWGSTSRRRARRKTAGCLSWAGGSSSRTRWSGPPPTARQPPTTGTVCTARWPRPPSPRPTRTGEPGTAPAPPRGPMRRPPPSSNARPAARRPAAASPPRPRSCNAPSSSRSTPRDEPAARWPRRGRVSRPARSRRRSRSWARRRPGRWMSSGAPGWTWCAVSLPSRRVLPAMLRRCC